MKARLLLLILTFLGGAMARASLGENETQVEARYGLPTRQMPALLPRGAAKMYSFRSMTVTVEFIEGKSESESFRTRVEEPFSATDVKGLLEANTPNGSGWWRPQGDLAELSTAPGGSVLIFNRQVVASASVSKYAVFITSTKYNDLYNQTYPGNRS